MLSSVLALSRDGGRAQPCVEADLRNTCPTHIERVNIPRSPWSTSDLTCLRSWIAKFTLAFRIGGWVGGVESQLWRSGGTPPMLRGHYYSDVVLTMTTLITRRRDLNDEQDLHPRAV